MQNLVQNIRCVCLQGKSRKDAEKYIARNDKYRRAYYKYHTGLEWENPYNYDLCLNSGKLGFEKCVDAILAQMEVMGIK